MAPNSSSAPQQPAARVLALGRQQRLEAGDLERVGERRWGVPAADHHQVQRDPVAHAIGRDPLEAEMGHDRVARGLKHPERGRARRQRR